MEELKNQVSDNISDNDLLKCYIKNNSNITDTLVEIWDIKTNEKKLDSTQLKWKEIRELCNDFDDEMNYQINKLKINSNNENMSIINKDVPKANCDAPNAVCDVPIADCDSDNDINEQST